MRIQIAPDLPNRVHPTAIISAAARLGAGITVGPFCVIEGKVEIGDGCVLGPHVTILSHTTLGQRCQLHAGAILGDLPQDQAYEGAESSVRIGDDCVVRECVTVHRGTKPGTVTEIGDGCLLMACSHVGHNAKLGKNVTLANGALLAGYTEIGDRAFISGNCLVHQFTRVGTLAMMSGGSATQMDVPPFCITRSLASNTVVGLNVIGLRRAGMPADERNALKRAFDILYRSGMSVSSAVAVIESQFDSPATNELCEFLRNSKRGVCKFFRDARKAGDGDSDPALAAA